MTSGQLNRRVTIQSPSTSQDAFGQPQSTWTTALTTWAGIRAATGKEVYAASGFTSQLTHIVTLRYRTDITFTAGMQVEYENRTFKVQAVSDPDEDRVQINLLCLEVNPNA